MDVLSSRAGMAVSTINRKFRQRYGEAPMHFLQGVRAQAAAKLINSSGMSLG